MWRGLIAEGLLRGPIPWPKGGSFGSRAPDGRMHHARGVNLKLKLRDCTALFGVVSSPAPEART